MSIEFVDEKAAAAGLSTWSKRGETKESPHGEREERRRRITLCYPGRGVEHTSLLPTHVSARTTNAPGWRLHTRNLTIESKMSHFS